MWCTVHHIPLLVIPIAALLVIAISALLVGGTIAGWDIVGFLTSPTAILVYVIAFVILLGVVYYFVVARRR